jgi:hypothetical protein
MADYAISNVPRRVVYAASGVGPYAFTFEILVDTDVAVYKDDALLTLTTDYTVTIAANGTGSITLVALPTGATQIAIVGSRAIQRTSDFVTGGDFFANTVNDELDSLTIFAQQNAEAVGRALQAPQTDPTNIDMTLPRASVRANKTLAFDSNGNPVTGEVIGDNRGDWAAGTAYNKRDIVRDAVNGNVYYANTAHTSSGVAPIDDNADAGKWDLLVDNASAGASATAAAASETAAAGSASAAASSASAASTSASNAATSASGAATSATNAANSATAASGSATTASTAATNAGNSATSASTSATNAANSETAAGTSATSASGSATAAAASETAAASLASSAATSASTATTQASNASTSATAAANSATAAATSATSALASLDSFKGQYYGPAASDPAVDPLGNAPTAGDLYFNTTSNRLRVYNATTSTWAEGNAGSVAVQNFNGTGSQTAFTLAAAPESENNTQVYISGVYQQKDQYSISGTTLTFTSSPPAGTNNIEVVTLNTLPLGVTSADLVQFQPAGVGAVLRTVQSKLRESVSITDFGASPTASTATNAAAIQAAFSSGAAYVTVPDAIFDCGNAVISVDHDDFTLVGLGTVSVNKTNNTFSSGPVIKATIASNSYDGISLKNIGVDTKLAALTEGIVIVNCRDVALENVTVIGSDTNNHCCLVENVQNSTTNGFTSYGGIQGFAIKAVDFFVNDVTSYDTTTYGFTARFSPSAPCNNGFINNVNLQTNLRARSGGFILMNDQSGAAMSDIIVNNVIVETCGNGIYITNTGNATKATRIKFSNVILRDIPDFAFQTFGNVDSISIDGIEFKDCAGTIFTNQATGTTRLTVSNLKQDSSGIALISGSGHIFNAWEKAGGGGFFGQNTSTNLQYYDMDVRVTPFSNITDPSGTGTIDRRVQFPQDRFIGVNGLLYAMRYRESRTRVIAASMAQNDEQLLFNLIGTNDNVAEITLAVLSNAGRFSAKYLICGTSITKQGGSSSSGSVFDIVRNGNEIRFKNLWSVTGAVYVDAIYSLFGEDV